MNSQSNMVILYKKGKASSNRLVSLTSVAFEFLENVCCTQLKTTLTETTISEQYGFRAIWFSCPSRWSPWILFKSLFITISRFPVCIISHNYVESIFIFIHPFVCVFVCYFSYLGHIFQTLKREVFSSFLF